MQPLSAWNSSRLRSGLRVLLVLSYRRSSQLVLWGVYEVLHCCDISGEPNSSWAVQEIRFHLNSNGHDRGSQAYVQPHRRPCWGNTQSKCCIKPITKWIARYALPWTRVTWWCGCSKFHKVPQRTLSWYTGSLGSQHAQESCSSACKYADVTSRALQTHLELKLIVPLAVDVNNRSLRLMYHTAKIYVQALLKSSCNAIGWSMGNRAK